MGSATKKMKKKNIINETPISDHQRWKSIYNNLHQLFRKQSQKQDALIYKCKLLQEIILSQRHSWRFDTRLLEFANSQLKRQLSSRELEKLYVNDRAEFRVSSKHTNSTFNKLKLEHAQCELDDLKACFDILSHIRPDKEVSSPNILSRGGSHTSMDRFEHQSKHEKEVAQLKREYEKLSAEYNFAWNQVGEVEKTYANQLQKKNDEINVANERFRILMTDMEQLQSAIKEKEEAVTHMKDDVNKKDEEIMRLLRELELIKSKITGGLNELPASGSRVDKAKDTRQSPVVEENATNAQLQATISTLRSTDMPEQSFTRSKSRCNGRGRGDTSYAKQLHSTSIETEEIVPALRANNACLIAEVSKKDDEISRILKELELIISNMPVVSNEPSTTVLKGIKTGGKRKRQGPAVEEGATNSQLQAMISTLKVKLIELQTESDQKSEEIFRLSDELKLLRSNRSTNMPMLRRCMNEPSSSGSRGRSNGRDGGTVAKVEADRNQKNRKITTLSRELESSSKGAGDTHSLKHCTTRSSSSRLRGVNNAVEQYGTALRKESSSAGLVSEQDGRRSKRKQDSTISLEDTPRLFTSQFKIPKLRSQSPCGR